MPHSHDAEYLEDLEREELSQVSARQLASDNPALSIVKQGTSNLEFEEWISLPLVRRVLLPLLVSDSSCASVAILASRRRSRKG